MICEVAQHATRGLLARPALQPPYRTAVYVAVVTGLRVSELLALPGGRYFLGCDGDSVEQGSVVTENYVRFENAEVPIIREIMAATTMSSLFVALFALVASSFRTRAALQTEILALRHQLAVFQRTRRVACASTAATGCCGLCCTDSGPVGGDVCRWFSPPRSCVGTAELSLGIGRGSRAAFPEGQKWQRSFAT